jgi:hypothetical protein
VEVGIVGGVCIFEADGRLSIGGGSVAARLGSVLEAREMVEGETVRSEWVAQIFQGCRRWRIQGFAAKENITMSTTAE